MTLCRLDQSFCPQCSDRLRRVTVDEPVLVRGGGYGATRRTVTDHCMGDECDWAMTREVSEVKP